MVILENRGYLERVPHRGFFTRKKVNEEPAHSLRPGLDDELYLSIAEDRISRRLPKHVSEADLVRRYKAPKSTLTRALQRFLREGLVERRPGRGWTFTPVLDSEEAHSQSCRFRLAIEPQALLEPGFHLDENAARVVAEKHRRILDGNTRRISTIELFEMNAEFHELLARCSGNRFFLQAVQQQNRLRRFVNYHWTYGPERVIRTCQEHLSILEAIQMNNPTWAATLMRRHIEISASISPYDDVDADTMPQHVIALK